jgi:putative transposase
VILAPALLLIISIGSSRRRSPTPDTKAVETAEGWLYLAVILALFSRLVIGWAMAATEDAA